VNIPKYPKTKTLLAYLNNPGLEWIENYKNKEESKIDYWDLDKHFTYPKIRKQYKRLPRKLKKKLNIFIYYCELRHSRLIPLYNPLLDDCECLNIKLWYLMEYTNPNYKRFLIQYILNKSK
jgi:hypothetical protein